MSVSRAGLLLALFVGACSDPKSDYQSYLDRTNGMRGTFDASVPETAAFDAPGDTGDFTNTYVLSCLPGLLGGDASKSLLFYSEVSVTAGKLTMKNTPILETATKMSKSQTVGTPHQATDVAIGADGSFTATVGHVEVPGNSQRIGDSLLVLENIVYRGHLLSKDRLCAEIDGQLTSPLMSSLDDPGDWCVWIAVPDGADLPTATDSSGMKYIGFAASEHHCP